MPRSLTWIVLCLCGLLFTPLVAYAAAQPAAVAPLTELNLIQAAYGDIFDAMYDITVRAYPDPDRDLTQVKTLAFDRPGQQNYLLAKELVRQLTGLLLERGYKIVEENPDVLVSLDFFIGRRDQYTPPNALQINLTGKSWPVGPVGWASGGPTSSVPGQDKPSYFRVIRVYFLDYSALSGGQELPQPPLVWAAEAESEGSSGDLREVAPMMLAQLLSEFPRPSGRAMSRLIYQYKQYGVIGVTFDPGTMVIREVQTGSPAEQAGLRPGDTILKVNNAGLPARFTADVGADAKKKDEVKEKLKPWFTAVVWAGGKEPVKLTVKRPGVKEDLTVTVTPVLMTTYVTKDQ